MNDRRRAKIEPEFGVWLSMLARCRNAKRPTDGYLGIKVCRRWHKYENFLADVGRKPSPRHSLDRYPDRGGDYAPGNVRWATRSQQARNRRPARWSRWD